MCLAIMQSNKIFLLSIRTQHILTTILETSVGVFKVTCGCVFYEQEYHLPV